jgi:hypothetical protein
VPKSPKKKPAPKGEKSSSGKNNPDEDSIRAGQEVMCETRKIFEEEGHTVRNIAKELAGIAYADITNFVDIDDQGIVRMKPVDEWPEGKGRIVRKIKEKRVIRTEKGTKDKPDGETVLDATFEFELHDKLDALGKAISVIGIQKPAKIDVNHSGSIMAAVAARIASNRRQEKK